MISGEVTLVVCDEPVNTIHYTGGGNRHVYPIIICDDSTGQQAHVGTCREYELETIAGITSVTVAKAEAGRLQDIAFKLRTLRALAQYLNETKWGTPTYDCRDFAWKVSAFNPDIPAKNSQPKFHKISNDDDVNLGELLAIGTETSPNSLNTQHWAIGLGGKLTLSVLGTGSYLGPASLTALSNIYDGVSYKIDGSKAII